MQKIRAKVFVGVPVCATDEEIGKAAALAQMLWTQNFLPILPSFYQSFFDATEGDYENARLQLLAECSAAIWIGRTPMPQAEQDLVRLQKIRLSDLSHVGETNGPTAG